MSIDKEKVKKMKDKLKEDYSGKSEDELFDELKKVGKNIKDKDKVLEKLKPLLNGKQKEKLDQILKKLK